MTIITAKLTASQFKKAFADDAIVANLSEQAVDYCLEVIEELQKGQSNPGLSTLWRDVFSTAAEITSEQLVKKYKDVLLPHYHSQLVSAALNMHFNDEIDAIIKDPEVSDYIIIRDHVDALLEYPDFLEAAAGVVGRDNFWHAFENGCWFKLV